MTFEAERREGRARRSTGPDVQRARGAGRNRIGQYTKPAPRLYPHQWNWDSGFIATGYAHYDQQRAQEELSTLFHAQWANGMIPQVVFNANALGGYFPEPAFWQGERSPNYPTGALTSGITMPPVHAIAARRILEHAVDLESVRGWLLDLYPRLVASHDYFHRERDPLQEGVAYIRHPWESGLDNSPVWDEPLRAIEIDPASLPAYERKDLASGVPAEQRPTDEQYDRYVYLVDLFRRLDYDEAAISHAAPFLVQDPLFNAILSKANEDLSLIAEFLGKDNGLILEWRERTNRALRDKMWHAAHGAYDVFDLVAAERIGTMTASGFLPLLCGAPSREEAETMYRRLESNSFCPMHDGTCFSIPNYDTDGGCFDADNYWRGPVWVNTNWLLAEGLER